MRDRNVATLWNLADRIIYCANEMLPVRTETSQGSVRPLTPILYAFERDAETVVDRIMK